MHMAWLPLLAHLPPSTAFAARVLSPEALAATASIRVVAEGKPNPSAKLVLVGYVTAGRGQEPNCGSIQSWSWSLSSRTNASLALVSATGVARPVLTILKDQLLAGSEYMFSLSATTVAGRELRASSTVVMNRPPRDGRCAVHYDRALPAVALSTLVELRCEGWVDDTEDLPLTYSFSYSRTDDGATAPTPLRGRSTRATLRWLVPAAGDWTAMCRISDFLLAATTVEVPLAAVRASALDTGTVSRVLDSIASAHSVGNVEESMTLLTALTTSLNQRVQGAHQEALAAAAALEAAVMMGGLPPWPLSPPSLPPPPGNPPPTPPPLPPPSPPPPPISPPSPPAPSPAPPVPPLQRLPRLVSCLTPTQSSRPPVTLKSP